MVSELSVPLVLVWMLTVAQSQSVGAHWQNGKMIVLESIGYQFCERVRLRFEVCFVLLSLNAGRSA